MSGPDLHGKHFQESSRLNGLSLGAAGSAIAFALHETADRRLEWPLAPILVAVVLWGASFILGYLSRKKVMQAINSNALQLEGQAENDPIKAAVSNKYANIHVRHSLIYQNLQEMLLVLGVALYIAGHIWHLAELPETAVTREPAVTQSPSAITATPAREQQDIRQRPAR